MQKILAKRLQSLATKTPVSENYPYEIYDHNYLSNLPKGSEFFYLIGENWLKSPHKEYVLAFGFNDWKFGFCADYLPKYRVAFAPRHFLGRSAKLVTKRLKKNLPDAIYVWGYVTPKWIENFAKRNKISFIRVEDGFIRSVGLGATHSIPYSLVFDYNGGLYYNNNSKHGLLDILNNFKFNTKILQKSRVCQKTIIEKSLSKYNPSVAKVKNETFKKEDILVLGQVGNDMSLKYGNPEYWTQLKLIDLAIKENPDSKIVYRPHPDVFHGHQNKSISLEKIPSSVEIQEPTGSLIDAIKKAKHVYVITSLGGFEALIYGLKVTTVGTPFYAGWGLTDDKTHIPFRDRKLGLDELFAGAYLIYSNYLLNLNDNYIGFQKTCDKIDNDRRELIRT